MYCVYTVVLKTLLGMETKKWYGYRSRVESRYRGQPKELQFFNIKSSAEANREKDVKIIRVESDCIGNCASQVKVVNPVVKYCPIRLKKLFPLRS